MEYVPAATVDIEHADEPTAVAEGTGTVEIPKGAKVGQGIRSDMAPHLTEFRGQHNINGRRTDFIDWKTVKSRVKDVGGTFHIFADAKARAQVASEAKLAELESKTAAQPACVVETTEA